MLFIAVGMSTSDDIVLRLASHSLLGALSSADLRWLLLAYRALPMGGPAQFAVVYVGVMSVSQEGYSEPFILVLSIVPCLMKSGE